MNTQNPIVRSAALHFFTGLAITTLAANAYLSTPLATPFAHAQADQPLYDLTVPQSGTINGSASSNSFTAVAGVPRQFAFDIYNNTNAEDPSVVFYNLLQRADNAAGTTGRQDINSAPMTGIDDDCCSVETSIPYAFSSADIGTKYIRLCADKDSDADIGDILELDESESSNCSVWVPVTVTLPPPTVSALLSPGNVASLTIPYAGAFTLTMTSSGAASCTWSRTTNGVTGPSDWTNALIPVANGGPLQFNTNNTFSGWTNGTYVWTFTCDNGTGLTTTKTSTLVVNPNVLPSVYAGVDRIVTRPMTTYGPQTDATASDTDGTTASVVWTQVGSTPSVASIVNNTTLLPTFNNLTTIGTYTFRLTVTDNVGGIATNDMTVTINSTSVLPTTATNLLPDLSVDKGAPANGDLTFPTLTAGTPALFKIDPKNISPNTTVGHFGAVQTVSMNSYTFGVAIADVDGDPSFRPDIITNHRTILGGAPPSAVGVSLNMGNGVFANPVYYPAGAANSFIVKDLVGDSRPDIAIPSGLSGGFSILTNTGGGTFGAPVSVGSGGYPDISYLAAGDFDGNGKDVVGGGGSGVSVFLNGGVGFGTATNYGLSPGFRKVAVGDLNGDNRDDIATTAYFNGGVVTDPVVSVLLNNGNGTFGAATDYSVGARPYSVAIGNLNNDTKKDIVVANSNDGSVSVLLNKGNGTFDPRVDYVITPPSGAADVQPVSVSLSDVNVDGRLDIVVGDNHFTGAAVLLNAGNGVFGSFEYIKKPFFSGVYTVATGDLNADGNPEIVLAGLSNMGISWNGLFPNVLKIADNNLGTVGLRYLTTKNAGPLAGFAKTSNFGITYTPAAGEEDKYYQICANQDQTGTLGLSESSNEENNCSNWTSAANTSPTASITAPASNQTISQGTSITFTGAGSDVDAGSSITAYEWRDGNCTTGTLLSTLASFQDTTLSTVGSPHTIYLRVKDNVGAWSINCPSRVITVGAAAVAPTVDASVSPTPIPYAGTFTLTMTSSGAASCTWSRTTNGVMGPDDWSNRPIPLTNGGPLQFNINNTFSGWVNGTYVWTFSCDNGTGLTTSKSATLIVDPNTRPTASITAPASNQTISQGTSITFTGAGSDVDAGSSITAYEWRDGNCTTGTLLSTLASFQDTTLSTVGSSHTIYLRVKDNVGAWSINCPSRVVTISPTPTVNLLVNGQSSATITIGDTAYLTWTSTGGVTSCESAGGFSTSPTDPPNSSPTYPSGIGVSPISSTNYGLNCFAGATPVTVFPVQVTVVEPVPSIKIDPPILPQLSGGGGGGGSNIRVTATCKNIPNGHMTVKNSLNDTLFDDDIDASGEHTYTSPPIQVNSAITYTVVCTPQFGDPDDDQFKKSVRVRFKTTIIEE